MPLYIKDGYSSYDEREVFELPVRKLLENNPDELSKLTEDTLNFILDYLMEDLRPSTPFGLTSEKLYKH